MRRGLWRAVGRAEAAGSRPVSHVSSCVPKIGGNTSHAGFSTSSASSVASMPRAFRQYKSNASLETSVGFVPNTRYMREDMLQVSGVEGLRLFQLSQETGSILTPRLIKYIKNALANLDENYVGMTGCFFTTGYDRSHSCDRELFCKGVDLVAFNNDREKYIADLHSLAVAIAGFNRKKSLICAYSGHVSGTGFGVFMGSRYRMSTPETMLIVDDLVNGHLPMGGFAYHFSSRNEDVGLEYSRYAAACGAMLHPGDLYSLGLVPYLAGSDPQDILREAYMNSERANLHAEVQVLEVYDDFLEELLQQIHLGDKVDVDNHSLWNRAFHVPPVPYKVDKADEALYHGDIRGIAPIVKQCFSTDDAKEALSRLEKEKNAFPVLKDSYATFSAMDMKLVQDWFDFTRAVQGTTLENCLHMEAKYYKK